MNYHLGWQKFGHKFMPHVPGHQLSAATGGLTAALVSTLLQQEPRLPPIPPLLCQDLDWWHYPSLVVGILLGLLLAQLLDLLYLLRQWLVVQLRQRTWFAANAHLVKQRLA